MKRKIQNRDWDIEILNYFHKRSKKKKNEKDSWFVRESVIIIRWSMICRKKNIKLN